VSAILGNPVVLTFGGEEPLANKQRSKIYPEGGIAYETYVPKVGWVVEEELVNPLLENLTTLVRNHLQEMGYIHG
jgi:hypothetical protein